VPGIEPAIEIEIRTVDLQIRQSGHALQGVQSVRKEHGMGLLQVLGSAGHEGIFASFYDPGGRVAWILRLVKTGAEGEGRTLDVMEITRPDGLGDIADLGLTLDETKRLLARLQQEIAAAQVKDHVARRPICSRCGGGCRVKDYQDHAVAMLFGRVTVRLPRFRCAECSGSESGIALPVDSGTGSVAGAFLRPHDLQNRCRSSGTGVSS